MEAQQARSAAYKSALAAAEAELKEVEEQYKSIEQSRIRLKHVVMVLQSLMHN